MLLTVIVPVYNIAQYLDRFFDSIKKQTFKDYSLIVVDDGSEDNSLQICRNYAKTDNRVRVISIKHSGVIEARKIALASVETEYVIFADGDDYVEPDYLNHLVEAREKYDSDLVVSRVQYLLENGFVEGAFRERGELYITREDFKQELPMLLDDRRLNYLYGKLYKVSLLKGIRVDGNVKQGSDTMINIQYLDKAKSIVLIDDLDYHYIRYKSRSITSYSGEDAFFRITKINTFIYEYTKKNDYLTDELLFIIDSRVLQSAIWVIDKILSSNNEEAKKEEQINNILKSDVYVSSYLRQQHKLSALPFCAIRPQSGRVYLNRRKRTAKLNNAKAKIINKTPALFLVFYRSIKNKDS